MENNVASMWVYLSTSPLLHLTVTVTFFVLARLLYRKMSSPALLNPVLVTVIVIVALLSWSNTSYEVYFEGAQFVHFLLGPATVALAIPLYRQISLVKRYPAALVASIATGSLVAMVSAVLIAKLGDVGEQTLISIAPKSITTPVAMGVVEQLGGLPSLTAVLVILTGIVGAAIGPWLLDKLRVTNAVAQGSALGVAAHGLGTGRAVLIGEVAAAFAGLAMGLNALITAVLLPVLWHLFM